MENAFESQKNNKRQKGEGQTNNNIRKLNLLLKKTLNDYEQKVGESMTNCPRRSTTGGVREKFP